MGNAETILILRARIRETEDGIAERRTSISVLRDPDEIAGMEAEITQLQQTLETLRTMVNNLDVSAATMQGF